MSLIAAPRNKFGIDEWAYQALGEELFIILGRILVVFDWIAVLVIDYGLGFVALISFPLTVNGGVSRVLEEAGCPPSHFVIVTSELDYVSELIGTGKSLSVNETRAPLDAVSEGEVNDEALRLGSVRLNHLLDDFVDKVIAEGRAVTHHVPDQVFQLS